MSQIPETDHELGPQHDPTNMVVVNEPEANQFLHREYRPGWTL